MEGGGRVGGEEVGVVGRERGRRWVGSREWGRFSGCHLLSVAGQGGSALSHLNLIRLTDPSHRYLSLLLRW